MCDLCPNFPNLDCVSPCTKYDCYCGTKGCVLEDEEGSWVLSSQ